MFIYKFRLRFGKRLADTRRSISSSIMSKSSNSLKVEDWNKEVHPVWYKDVTPMRRLILGSFPPHASRWAYPFFYPNRRNRFWKILADLAGVALVSRKNEDELAVEERYRIMKKLETGVQNLGLEIERNGKSALDTRIRIKKFQDVISIIDAHPELERILLPGYSAPHSTTRSFIRYLQENGIKMSLVGEIKPGATFEIELKGRLIACVVLNSTSPASRVEYDIILDQFRRNLGIPTTI